MLLSKVFYAGSPSAGRIGGVLSRSSFSPKPSCFVARSFVGNSRSSGEKGSTSRRKLAMKRQRGKLSRTEDIVMDDSGTGISSSSQESDSAINHIRYRSVLEPSSNSDPSTTPHAVGSITQWHPRLDLNVVQNSISWQAPDATRRLGAEKTPRNEIMLEQEAMFDPSIHLPYAPRDWKGYEPATPLFHFLMQRIGATGQPITTAEYIRHSLTHPLYGYYTNPRKARAEHTNSNPLDDWDNDDLINSDLSPSTSSNESTIIGPKGDFVTAPEMSHVFGHCICVWMITQWQTMGKPENIQLLELGPGRGTLMADILQLATSSKLRAFGEAIRTIHLVEASRELRQQQQSAIKLALEDKVDFEFVYESSNRDDHIEQKSQTHPSVGKTSKSRMRVRWHDDFASFQGKRDPNMPVMMLAQEFFDALPVHSFQMTDEGWRERMIDVASVDQEAPESSDEQLKPRLRQVLSPDTTPAADLLLSSDEYKDVSVGTVVEVCPEGLFLVQDMAKVLEEVGGYAIIVDYGQLGTSDTLRAFSSHKQVPLTSYPGRVDITADVDFFALSKSVEGKVNGISVFGPVTQGEFLMRMGAGEMVINSIEKEDTTVERANDLSDALKFLVMPEHMGEKFKVLAIGRKRDGIFAPPGMER